MRIRVRSIGLFSLPWLLLSAYACGGDSGPPLGGGVTLAPVAGAGGVTAAAPTGEGTDDNGVGEPASVGSDPTSPGSGALRVPHGC